MGMNDAKQNQKDDKARARAQKRKLGNSTVANTMPADWEGVDGALLVKFVAAVARDGGAARLGYTRDGGAYAIGIYGDGDPYTVYVSPKEDIDEWLREGIESFTA
jgi:hypothetical protein